MCLCGVFIHLFIFLLIIKLARAHGRLHEPRLAATNKVAGQQRVGPRLEMFELNQAAQCGDLISSRAAAAPQTGHRNEVAAFQQRPNKTLLLTQPQ